VFKKYTVKQLAELLECSEVTARKKVKRKGFEGVEEVLYGRPVEVYSISDDNINKLIEETRRNKEIYTKHVEGIKNISERFRNSSESIIEGVGKSFESSNNEEKQESEQILLIKDLVNDTKNLYERLLKDKEKVLYLLEDKQKTADKDIEYWKEEYFKLKYENETLNQKILELQAENQQLKAAQKQVKKWWQFKTT
jgi:predicted ArsR family transcriptional regulator